VIVDGHVHLFRQASPAYPRDVHELYPADREAPAEHLMTLMQAHGVSHAVVVPLSPGDEYLMESRESHPGLFTGIGVHDLESADPAADAERRRRDHGVSGLRVSRLGDPDARRASELTLFPLLERMAELGMKLWFYSTPDQLSPLAKVAAELPQLDIVLNHLGFCPTGMAVRPSGLPWAKVDGMPPSTFPTVLELERFPNVYVMVSGQYGFSAEPFPYDDVAPVLVGLYERYGPRRLFWASDYPWIAQNPGYGRVLALPHRHLPGIPAADLEEIMGGTAARLFGVRG
jgi:predicted TIM-barrel fold metal-dependent hydrolase